jgi:hypothetical protein
MTPMRLLEGNYYYNQAGANNYDSTYNQWGGGDYYYDQAGGSGYYPENNPSGRNNYYKPCDQTGGGNAASGCFDYNELTESNTATYSQNQTDAFQQAAVTFLVLLLVLLLPTVILVQRFRKRRKQAKKNRIDYVAPTIRNDTILCTGSLGTDGERNNFEVRWSELPRSAKTAALALAYNQTRWDRDEAPELLSNMCWDDLTQTQQGALLQLGTEDWNDITRNWNGIDPGA